MSRRKLRDSPPFGYAQVRLRMEDTEVHPALKRLAKLGCAYGAVSPTLYTVTLAREELVTPFTPLR